jgi:hypothetical protein
MKEPSSVTPVSRKLIRWARLIQTCLLVGLLLLLFNQLNLLPQVEENIMSDERQPNAQQVNWVGK